MTQKNGTDNSEIIEDKNSDWEKPDGSEGPVLKALKEHSDWSDTEVTEIYTDEEEAGELKQFNIKILEPTSWEENTAILEFDELKDYWDKPELFYFKKNREFRNNLYLFPIAIHKNEEEIQKLPGTGDLPRYAVTVEDVCPFMRSDPYGIYAIDDGTVNFVHENGTGKTEETKKSSYGNYVVIKHEDGSQTMYAHLSNYTVKKGDQVKGGAKIGVMGGSGDGNAAKWDKHLHLSYFPANLSSQEMNPSWLAEGRFPDKENGMIKTTDPKDFIEENHYPCNTKKSGSYHEIYDPNGDTKKSDKGVRTNTSDDYKHEGIDFSGRTTNLLPNWEFGLYQQSL